MKLRIAKINSCIRHTANRLKSPRTWPVLLLLVGLVLGIGLAVSADPPYPVTVTITGDAPDPSVVGQAYKVEFEVRIDSVDTLSPWGTVTVVDGTGATCSISVLTGYYQYGWSSWCNLTSTSAGIKTITATFVPSDGNFMGGSDTELHTVDKADTTVTITDPGPTVVGEPYTVSGDVTVDSPGSGTPTGTVTVDDGEGNSCAANLDGSGNWSCTLTSTSASVVAKTLTATYEGDENFNGSSDTEEHTVNMADTTIEITAHTPETSVVGEGFEVFWSVTVNSPGSGTPTGDVTVNADKTPPESPFEASCSASAENGSCTLTLDTSDGPGTYQLTADYAGDANFNLSPTSGPVDHVANRADTTITVDSPIIPEPSVVGESYTVGGTVTANAPGSGTPIGQVTVNDGENACTVALAIGNWSCSTMPSTTAGPKTLTVSYTGDANFNVATTTVGHDVNRASTSIQISAVTPSVSTGNPLVGEAYTVNGTQSVTSPGDGTPTGFIQVQDTDGNSCEIPAAASWSGCAMTSTSAGGKTLTAIYSGDCNFVGATTSDPQFSLTVEKRDTSIEIIGPSSACVGESITLTAQVSDATNPPVLGSPDSTSTNHLSAP